MKILLANYRYFVSSGPERYLFNITGALQENGHEVIPFSVNYSRNIATPYSRYFVSPIGSPEEVYFRDTPLNLTTVFRTLKRLFYDPEVEAASYRLARDTNVQIAYVLCYLRKLSPALIVGLKKAGLPVIVRFSDFGMLCPELHCVRDSQPCELCIKGQLLPSIRYKCVQGSTIASTLNALATTYHRIRHYFDLVDIFVTTNPFMHQMMLKAGFPEHRLQMIPTFVNPVEDIPKDSNSIQSTITFIGRLVKIKGVHIFLQALAQLKQQRPDLHFSARVVGRGDPNYFSGLADLVRDANLQDNVTFVGEKDSGEVFHLLNQSLVSVIPSICYENLPNSLLESFACATPVIASDIGSLPFIVKPQVNGLLFRANDAGDLAKKLVYALENPAIMKTMGENARLTARSEHSPENHMSGLMDLFNRYSLH
jgi:glycosyltransferase involved in cell wall biosynthesis